MRLGVDGGGRGRERAQRLECLVGVFLREADAGEGLECFEMLGVDGEGAREQRVACGRRLGIDTWV